MSSPYKHAESSVRRWGGAVEDYLPIHEFLDSTKLHLETWQHRAVLHSTFGVGVCEQVFGRVVLNSEGKNVEVRYIAIQHIKEDCGHVPTIKEWLHDLRPKKFAINLIKESENEHQTRNDETLPKVSQPEGSESAL